MKAMKFSPIQLAILGDNLAGLEETSAVADAALNTARAARSRLNSNTAKFLNEQAGTDKAVEELDAAMKEGRVKVDEADDFSITITEKDE